MERPLNEIQTVINQLLNVKSLVRGKKKTQEAKKKINRQDLMYAEFDLDLSNYDEAFLDTIDALIILHFGKEGAELIAYYLWDRIASDGTVIPLMDIEGKEVFLETAQDLWNLLVVINPNYDDQG